MKKKSFKICTTIIFFLFSIQSAFCENLITPKPKPNLAKEKKDKYISGIIIPKFKPGTYVSEDQLELLKELKKENEILEFEINNAKNSDDHIENFARENLNLSYPNEEFIIFEEIKEPENEKK